MKGQFIKIVISVLLLVSCGESNKELHHQIKDNISKDSILSNDQEFIRRQILKGKYQVDLAKYLRADCSPILLSKENQMAAFEGFQNVGDIDDDQIDDFVFVLPPLNHCEDGQSYYFSNPTISRIQTDSYCCHPNSIFSLGDIDEDGRNEIAQYYSSCAGRYKRIYLWTNKNDQWELMDDIAFTLNDEYVIFKDFHKLHGKRAKGVFQFLEISDILTNGDLVKAWKTIDMQ